MDIMGLIPFWLQASWDLLLYLLTITSKRQSVLLNVAATFLSQKRVFTEDLPHVLDTILKLTPMPISNMTPRGLAECIVSVSLLN